MGQRAVVLGGLLLLSVFLGLAHCGENRLRGVHPADEHLYTGPTFSCKDGSKTGLPLSKVNDDYCDCADGSDEPGTSACPNGQFLCRNLGHVAVSLFSSRVNDGVCDCCDGTDEYDGQVQCQDTCYSLGEETRAAKRQELEAVKRGLTIREQYVNAARNEKEQKQNKLAELKANVGKKQEEKDALQAQLNQVEEKARVAKELLAKYKPKEEVQQSDEAPADQPHEIPAGEFENEDGEDDEEDDDDDDDKDPEGAQPQEELLERTEDVREALEQAEKDVAEYMALKRDEEREGEDEADDPSSLWRWLGSFIGLASSASPSSPLSGELKISDLKELRQRISNVDDELNRLRSDVSSIEDYLALDLGDEAFHGIRDQTFELQTNQYTYKLSPFNEVKQQFTRLGTWARWLDAEHTQMEYSGGERCWNGPDRKTIVELDCGENNQVISVEEPNKCEYLMKFTTPAACSPDKIARLEADLAVLENPKAAALPINTHDIF